MTHQRFSCFKKIIPGIMLTIMLLTTGSVWGEVKSRSGLKIASKSVTASNIDSLLTNITDSLKTGSDWAALTNSQVTPQYVDCANDLKQYSQL